MQELSVTTVEELRAATSNPDVQRIVVRGRLAAAPGFRLAPGQSLHGDGGQARIDFGPGSDGLRLSSDNFEGI